ncbi:MULTISPECIES: spore germination protein [Lysinibacillus]|uniref:Spore gernimation protein n=1 Tax=Lysinibacillus fusiformis TaxID=28031 RepID=A0A1E4R4Y0_9BACI|nr:MULTISPECIES: spore germination protein [Lysinibacillus]ODV55503.1 spore gernimation protein [Lysinibacillus fusiformis]
MTENKDFFYKELGHQSDITVSSKFYMFNNEKHEVIFIYCHSLIDSVLFLNSLLPNIRFLAEQGSLYNVEIINRYLEVQEIIEYRMKTDEINSQIFSGFLYFYHVPSNSLYSTNLAKLPERSIEESNMEVSLRGPRDGFVENIDTNFSLIRMRLKSKNLSSDNFTIGDTSKTKVLLIYIENYIDQNTLKNVQTKLNKIKVDNIASSYHIEELLYDKLTLFPLLDYSGRPDFVVSSLNKGRFVILVDGSPSCLIGPVNLLLILKAPEDDQTNFLFVSFSRILRITSLLTSIFLPGFWIALTVHQLNQLPFPLLVSISASKIGLPVSSSFEILIMLIFFDLFREAGIRLPKAVGQTVAVLGGLIVGDAAIRAGFTSPSTLVIGALTVISSYTLINQNVLGNVFLIRVATLIIASFFGMYGFVLSVLFFLTYISSLESFGHSYLSTFYKVSIPNLIKGFLKMPFRIKIKD